MNDPTPRRPRVIVACGISLFAMLFGTATTNAAESKPNVVFILADDLGWSDTTLFGATKLYRTPNIERLAKRGMTFTRTSLRSVRIDPSRGTGTIQISQIQLTTTDGDIVHQWSF